MTVRLNALAIGDGRVRLSWTLSPQPTLDVLDNGTKIDEAQTSTTIVFLEEQTVGKHVYQVKDPVSGAASNKVTVSVT